MTFARYQVAARAVHTITAIAFGAFAWRLIVSNHPGFAVAMIAMAAVHSLFAGLT